LREDQHVDHTDDPAIHQREQLSGHLAGEVARARGELDDDVVDGAELVERYIGHDAPFCCEGGFDQERTFALACSNSASVMVPCCLSSANRATSSAAVGDAPAAPCVAL